MAKPLNRPNATMAGAGSSSDANRAQNTPARAAAAAPSGQPVTIQSAHTSKIVKVVESPDMTAMPTSRCKGADRLIGDRGLQRGGQGMQWRLQAGQQSAGFAQVGDQILQPGV